MRERGSSIMQFDVIGTKTSTAMTSKKHDDVCRWILGHELLMSKRTYMQAVSRSKQQNLIKMWFFAHTASSPW